MGLQPGKTLRAWARTDPRAPPSLVQRLLGHGVRNPKRNEPAEAPVNRLGSAFRTVQPENGEHQGQSQVRQPSGAVPSPSSSRGHMDSSRRVCTIWGKDSTHQSVSVLCWDTRSQEETARCQCPGFGNTATKCSRVAVPGRVVCTCFRAEPLYRSSQRRCTTGCMVLGRLPDPPRSS